MKKILTFALALISICAAAQQNGGITPEMLKEIQKGYEGNAADKAIRNAMNSTALNVLATNAENSVMIDTHFSDMVKTKGRTDQKSSGRCWLFTGLNVLRAAAIYNNDLGDFQFSQCYCFFYDQLEKSNLFLQAIIDTKDLPLSDRKVDWLFANPLSDGGTFTGVADLVMKYGVVPSTVMPETFTSNSTSQFCSQMKTVLRQDGIKLREMSAEAAAKNSGLKGKKAEAAAAALDAQLQSEKTTMLKEVYRLLCLAYGVPPTEFEWTRRNSKDEAVSTKTYTPQEFYQEFVGYKLNDNYVMVMDDPSREYNKVYEIEYDRHVYDGHNWVYLNIPVDRIKEMAIASIKDNNAMYFSCDVGKYLDRTRGLCDLRNFDYESLLGVKFTMNKTERIQAHASGSSHAMTLIGVDLKDGKTGKWLVENSWGAASGWKGNIIMTDDWFNEYMFRLVVERKYIPADLLPLLDQEPVMLPSWDPMFSEDE